MSTDDPLDARMTIGDGVVRRGFADETIVLNLTTGQYYGLNATATAMVDAIAAGETPRSVAQRVAAEAGVDAGVVEQDVRALVLSLQERQLLATDG